MFGIVIVGIIILVVFLIINYNMAQNMQEIVEKKGYTDLRVVTICFWLGIIGYLYVIALPDLEERRLLKKIAGEEVDVGDIQCSERVIKPRKPIELTYNCESIIVMEKDFEDRCTFCQRKSTVRYCKIKKDIGTQRIALCEDCINKFKDSCASK